VNDFSDPSTWFIVGTINAELNLDFINNFRVAPVAFGTTEHNRAQRNNLGRPEAFCLSDSHRQHRAAAKRDERGLGAGHLFCASKTSTGANLLAHVLGSLMLLQLFGNPLLLCLGWPHPIDEMPNFICKFVFPMMLGRSLTTRQPRCKPLGLTKRGGVWHINKQIGGTRVCESTGTSELAKAQEQLAKRVDDARKARLYGVRGDYSFRVAATKYLEENRQKRSIGDDAMHLRQLDPFIGTHLMRQVHMGTLQEFVAKRRKDGVKTKSINATLAVVRRILRLAASEWMDDRGMAWLETAPKIRLFPVTDARLPYPLSAEEQMFLFRELPAHLAKMALFKVNTGTREQEVCGLKWSHEVKVPEFGTSVFLILLRGSRTARNAWSPSTALRGQSSTAYAVSTRTSSLLGSSRRGNLGLSAV
jgi:hypothetical protein